MPTRGEDQLKIVFSATSNDKLRNAYDQWAERYDGDLRAFGYTYPAPLAGLVCRYVARRAAPILDAGCGTGAVGEVLAILGYKGLSGVDLSGRMLEVARRKGVYAELRRAVLGRPLDFPDDHFAATVSAGVLTTGHLAPTVTPHRRSLARYEEPFFVEPWSAKRFFNRARGGCSFGSVAGRLLSGLEAPA